MAENEFENNYGLSDDDLDFEGGYNKKVEPEDIADSVIDYEIEVLDEDDTDVSDNTADIAAREVVEPADASFPETPQEPVYAPSQPQIPQQNPYNGYNNPYKNPPYQNPSAQYAPQNQPPHTYEWYGGAAGYNNPKPYNQQPQMVEPKPKKERKGVSRGAFVVGIAICLCLSFLAGFAGTWVYGYLNKPTNTNSGDNLTINKVDQSGNETAYSDGGLSTVDIVEKSADSVVEITTEIVKTGVFAQQYIDSGAGSGVIIDTKGYIVTNHHVIDGASRITVTLRNGESYEAELLGSDAEIDIALLEISTDSPLTAATFGDSDNLRVGQRTVAIGNPLGQLGGTVTEGIISALNRDVVIDGQTMKLMQTDTAINPGNSGGGLFDAEGNLIGIVNAKSTGSEIDGLGFAIPINDVINVVGDLSEFGYVRGRVDLGMEFINVDSEQLAWMYGLNKTGCYIYSVDKNTNAMKAGLSSGDRVISVNDIEVNSSDEVESIIENCNVGEKVTFKVENTNGRIEEVSFKLEEYVPDTGSDNFFDNNSSLNDYSYWWSNYN